MSLNPADETFVRSLAGKLPEGLIAPVEPRHLEDPRRRQAGHGHFVARPRSTEEVAAIVRACNAARVGIVPYGGGTGLVLGQLAGEGPLPLILSLERMAAIRAVYPAVSYTHLDVYKRQMTRRAVVRFSMAQVTVVGAQAPSTSSL